MILCPLQWKCSCINFFGLCREYQEQIPFQKMAEGLRDYADRLDGWRILANKFQ